MKDLIKKLILISALLIYVLPAFASQPGEEAAELFVSYGVQIPDDAPERSAGEGAGPYERLVIDRVMLVDGLGSPPRGPVSIVIEKDQITEIHDRSPKSVLGEERFDARGRRFDPG